MFNHSLRRGINTLVPYVPLILSLTVKMDTRFVHPFRGQICGGSSSGKTYFTHKFLRNVQKLVTTAPDYILWFYGEIQPIYEEILKTVPNIQFIEGFPSNFESLLNPTKAGMIIIDDLLQELASDDRLSKLFTKTSHHKNVSILFLTQNFFYGGSNRVMRTVSLNTEYFLLMKNPRDASQITNLAKQMYPGNVHFLQESYRDATKEPYSYLLIDLKMTTPDHLRLRTRIFPGERQAVYIQKQMKL